MKLVVLCHDSCKYLRIIIMESSGDKYDEESIVDSYSDLEQYGPVRAWSLPQSTGPVVMHLRMLLLEMNLDYSIGDGVECFNIDSRHYGDIVNYFNRLEGSHEVKTG